MALVSSVLPIADSPADVLPCGLTWIRAGGLMKSRWTLISALWLCVTVSELKSGDLAIWCGWLLTGTLYMWIALVLLTELQSCPELRV